jgi:hypothetical protein
MEEPYPEGKLMVQLVKLVAQFVKLLFQSICLFKSAESTNLNTRFRSGLTPTCQDFKISTSGHRETLA